MNRTVLAAVSLSVVAMAAAILAGVWTGQFEGAPKTAAESTSALIGGPFTLTDHRGNEVTEAALLGHYSLIFFGYTDCPDVCPLTLQNISAALDELGRRADDLLPLFITVDPARDTPEVLATYVSHFHPQLVALTGTPEQIAAAASAYRIFFAPVDPVIAAAGAAADDLDLAHLLEHTSVVYIMGPHGKYVTHFSHATPVDEMVQRLGEML